jgi:hypothetical protein
MMLKGRYRPEMRLTGSPKKAEAPAAETDHPVIHCDGSPGMIDINGLGGMILDKRTLACFAFIVQNNLGIEHALDDL